MTYPPKRKRRLGILGAGAITQIAHLPALQYDTGFDLTAIADPSAKSLERIQQLGYRGKVIQADAFGFLSDAKRFELDAILIAIPNWLHCKAALQAMETGLHVLCEKPLALSREECDRISAAAHSCRREIVVGMVRRFYPSMQTIKEALRGELIGKIESVQIEDGFPYGWPADSGAAFNPKGGGILAATGVHFLDVLQDWFGSLSPTHYEDDFAGGCEANATLSLETKEGIPILLRLSYEKRLANSIEIKGKLGSISLSSQEVQKCTWTAKRLGALAATLEPARKDSYQETPLAPYIDQLIDFRKAIEGEQTLCCTADQAAEVMGVIEWAYRYRSKPKARAKSRAKRPSIPPSPVLVTGGTGFVGTHLIERLTELQCQPIVAPVRNYRTCAVAARFGIRMPLIDLLDFDSVKKAVTGVRYVFHLAYGRGEGDRRDGLATVQGTKNVVEAAIEAGVESIVIVSTLDVFGRPPGSGPYDESAPHVEGGHYRVTKAEAERWCLERAKRSPHTRMIVLNPGCIFGPRGEAFVRLPVTLAASGAFCWVENGRGIANYTFVDNFVDAILLAAVCEEAAGKRFIISDGHCTWREFIEPLLGRMGKEIVSYSEQDLLSKRKPQAYASLKDLGKAIVRSQGVRDVLNNMRGIGRAKAWIFDHFPRIRELFSKRGAALPHPITNRTAEPATFLADFMGPAQSCFTSKRATETLGWQPLVSLEEGQRRTIEWLKDSGLPEVADWHTTPRELRTKGSRQRLR